MSELSDNIFRSLVRADPWLRAPREESWVEIESWVGVELPRDFKEFVRLYGDGLVMRHLNVPHPNGIDPLLNFMKRARRKLEMVLPDYVADFGSLSFDPKLVIPWGYSNWDGDDCFLVPRTGGEWDVLVVFRQLACIRLYGGGFSSFITGVISEQEVPPGWPVLEPLWEPVRGTPLV
ncbi:SMI1/KNR4 family protein [Kitasatospora purpeofusca]|uniref:SMI1/KNR4 family protein n=1 Tax=Kitasatospora purpeofusca TaxID=67352 RepID=UPI00381E844B